MTELLKITFKRETLWYMFAVLQSARCTNEVELRTLNAIFSAIISIVKEWEARKIKDEEEKQRYVQQYQTQMQNHATEEMKALTEAKIKEIGEAFDVYADEDVTIELTTHQVDELLNILHNIMGEKRLDKNKVFAGVYGSEDVRLYVDVLDTLQAVPNTQA